MISESSQITKIGEHSIKLIPNSKPKMQKSYRIRGILKEIDDLLALELVEASESEYRYPIFCVSKKDGTLRICVDFRYMDF